MAIDKDRFDSTILNDIDGLIRSGNAPQARRKLQTLKKKKPGREWLVKLAALARRAGVPSLGIRMLNPIVRPPPNHPAHATPAEKAEYAASLVRIGATGEALAILSALDKTKIPEALLFESLARFTRWDYSSAIPLLTSYASASSVDPYSRLVGKVNLAAAFLQVRDYVAADEILKALRSETAEGKFSLLNANSLELSAQLAIYRKQWKEADAFLDEASHLLRRTGILDELFVKKWKAIASVLRDGGKTALGELAGVRKEAISRRHWETLRDCDLYRAIVTADTALVAHLYFGTPFDGYRKRILVEYGRPFEPPDVYWWKVPPGGVSPRDVRLLAENGGLKAGQLMHRLLATLASDFYRPQRLAPLHAEIYPEEYFNPVSSPMRVHQAVSRLRAWLHKKRFPLSIDESGGGYQLIARSPCRLAIVVGAPRDLADTRLGELRRAFPAKPFSATEAAARLEVSARTALRLLQSHVERGELAREGRTSAIRYRFRS